MERANTLLRSLTARKRGIDSAEALISEGHNFENGEAILCTLTSVRRVYWKSLRSQADPASIILALSPNTVHPFVLVGLVNAVQRSKERLFHEKSLDHDILNALA